MANAHNYWVWVTGPKYFLEEDGEERKDLDPGSPYVPGGWWTCHKNTEEGDLVLLYRKTPKKDIAYLIQARSPAYSLLDDPDAAHHGWDYGCDQEFIEKFRNPMTLKELKEDPAVQHWGALRANFMGSTFRIPPDIWDHLMGRLSDGKGKSRRNTLTKLHRLEKEIEDRLAKDLSSFRAHGFNLKLQARQHICLHGGRADLVCREASGKRYVVIELKRGLIGRDAVAQVLSYRASVKKDFPARQAPTGVLVGERLDNEALGMVEDDKRLEFLSFSALGLPDLH